MRTKITDLITCKDFRAILMIIGHKIFHIIDQFKKRDEKYKVALAVELSIIVNQVEKSLAPTRYI